jgi:lipase
MFTVAAPDGLRLALHDYGGCGEPVLLLHGITANGRSMEQFARALLPRRVFALDFRGRGDSERPSRGADLAEHAQDARAALSEIRTETGADPDVLGHSMGALVALLLAADPEAPLRRAVLVDAAGDVPLQDLEAIRPSLQRLEQEVEGADPYIAAMRAVPHLQPWNDACEAFARWDLELTPAGRARSRVRAGQIMEEIARNQEIRLTPYQSRVERPVLILRAPEPVYPGGRPVFSRASALAAHAAIAGSLLIEVPGTHHYSIGLQEQPIVAEAVRRFLG